ncbi:DinB family protein [Aquirhabdus parva]|uniref:DinB family protein n=1 Tax=Aquirhabdus parva TaxID=2283318 RepID=UPI001AE2F795|nr:DinB family protein [Aquirhabdus parva]
MRRVKALEHLFRYKAEADREILAALASLDRAAPATEIAIRTLAHVSIVDQIFLAHMTCAGHDYTSANATVAPTLEKLSDEMQATDSELVAYVTQVDDGQLAEVIDFNFVDGDLGRMSRSEMLMHLITHSSYHRGQVGWMLTINGVTPPADGLTRYLHAAEAVVRRRDTTPQLLAPDLLGEKGNDVTVRALYHDTAKVEPLEISRLEALTERIKDSVASGIILGKTLKFNLKGDGFIFIDGKVVSNEDKQADLTLSVGMDDLRAIGQGKLAPMAAVLSGRLRVSDMGVALGLQSQMKALFINSAS